MRERPIARRNPGTPTGVEAAFTPVRRYAEHGFTPVRRYAEHGFTPLRRYAEHGFTLVEVMIALLIFGMIAAAGVAILSFSVRAQGATATRLDDIFARNRTIALVSADLGQAIDRPARDEAGQTLPAFTGGADGQLRFVRAGWANIDAAPRASLQKVVYGVEDGALVRIAYPMIDGAAPLPPVVLLSGVAGVAARYRIRGAWGDRWDGTQGAPLPQAAELVVRRTDGSALRIVALVGTGYLPPLAPPNGGLPSGAGSNAPPPA